jgi:hypothetical protein
MARRFRLAFSRALEGRNRWLEDGRGRRAAAHLLTRDEARCIAGVHRKAPELLRKREATAAAPGRRDEGAGDAPDTVALAALYHRAGAAMTDTIGTIIAFLFFVIVVELGLIIFGRPRRERPERHALATWYFEEEPGRRSAARLILNFLSGQ